jgi:hypothetical protein
MLKSPFYEIEKIKRTKMIKSIIKYIFRQIILFDQVEGI